MYKNLLNYSKLFNPQQLQIKNSVKKFSEQYLQPRVLSDFKYNNEIKDIYKNMGNLGIFGSTINEYDCLGESNLTYGIICKEIEKIDSGYRSMLSVQSSLVMKPIYEYSNNELKDKYMPELKSGNMIGCFGLTEPDFGSNPSDMKTSAIKDGNYFILNGSKTWITNSPVADLFIVWAKYNNKVCGFILDRDMNGIETPVIKDKMSLNTSITGSIFLNNVKVPSTNILNIEGLKGPFSCLNSARFGISFGTLGAAESCIDTVIDYTNNRSLFGNLMSEKQLIQKKISDMCVKYNTSLATCVHIANCIDNDHYIPEMISMIKLNSCKSSLDIARDARDIMGANGISSSYPIFRHMINLETVNTYEGTSDIHSLILGKYITKKSAF